MKNTYRLPEGKRLRLALRDWFREQRKAVLAFYRTGVIERKDDDPEGGLWELPEWDEFGLGEEEMAAQMTPLITAIFEEQGREFLINLGLDPEAWEVTSPYLEDVVRRLVLDFCRATNETTSREIGEAIRLTREALHEGLVSRGESVDRLARRIGEIFDNAELWRARRIAQTEAIRAAHAAQEQAGIASEVVVGWQWLASEDACPMCLTIARRCKFVRLGQPFAVIGDHPDYSVVKFPPAHPGCRCSRVEVLDIDEEPEWGQTLIQPEPEQQDIDAAEQYAEAHQA